MKITLSLLLLLILAMRFGAQDNDSDRIAQVLDTGRILAPLRYLASDELRGRHIGLPEIDTAAKYIALQFYDAGASPIPGTKSYYQVFRFLFAPADLRHMDQQVASNLNISANRGTTIRNVLAMVRGTDPVLRNQYIVLSAHYDHAGVRAYATTVNGKLDSIFNGARDNATGTAAVIAAARYFARYPPKRSILFICYSGEEEGAIGSHYYAAHPVVALDQTVFDLNVDNAGYNTTHAICLFGLGRTSADSTIRRACKSYGLSVYAEPPDLELFKRSDNYSLAQKGIPAPNFSLGMTGWNEEVDRYYHGVGDEVETMDLDYVVKFVRAFVLSAEYIANDPAQPRWTRGDEFEKNWRTLFKRPR